MMALYKVVPIDRSKKVVVKASTLEEVKEKAIAKLQIGQDEYQVALDEDGTLIDEDDILLELAAMSKAPITLMLIPQGQCWATVSSRIDNDVPKATAATQSSIPETHRLDTSSMDTQAHERISIGSNLWIRFPKRLLQSCEKEEPVRTDDRRAMVAVIADYMLQDLKDTTRKTAERIARMIFEKYPVSFSDMIDGQILGAGMESLRAQIYTAVHYRKELRVAKKKCTDTTGSDNSDSESSSMSSISRKQDEYGCVDYQPLLPINETKTSQETKRLSLIAYYNTLEANDEKIIKLMDETYVSQRDMINKPSRSLEKIFLNWPFFRDGKTLLRHASRLLGKPVEEVWNTSLLAKAEPITKYFKSAEIARDFKGRKNRKLTDPDAQQNSAILTLIQEAEEQFRVSRSEVPRLGVIFSLIIHHMRENQESLFLVVDNDLSTEAVEEKVETNTPLLIIRGKSYLDANASYEVLLEGKIWVKTTGLLEGLLLTFAMYYIFGYAYPMNLASTLEFIQRVFLLVNPTSGDKRDCKKRRQRSYDPKVLKLTNELNEYTSTF